MCDDEYPHCGARDMSPLDPRGSHWRRSLIVWPDGRRDDTSAVDWLQGPTLYIDLRCPADRPDFATTPRLDDLGWNAVTWLARQEGFAGRLQFDGECFEWERVIDYQPKSVAPDIGRLWLENGVMIEQGRDIPYVEHWHRQDGARAPCAAVRLRQQGQDSEGFIVRLGSTFMYTRARTVATQAGLSLSECVTRGTFAYRRPRTHRLRNLDRSDRGVGLDHYTLDPAVPGEAATDHCGSGEPGADQNHRYCREWGRDRPGLGHSRSRRRRAGYRAAGGMNAESQRRKKPDEHA
jgi:hypothetical protein